jgi:hypothetical protein
MDIRAKRVAQSSGDAVELGGSLRRVLVLHRLVKHATH